MRATIHSNAPHESHVLLLTLGDFEKVYGGVCAGWA